MNTPSTLCPPPSRTALLIYFLSVSSLSACSGGTATELPAEWSLPVAGRVLELARPADSPASRRALGLTADLVIEPADASFRVPHSLAVNDAGTIYALDYSNRRIEVFDATGQWIRAWGEPGRGPEQFFGPTQVATTAENVVVVDPASWRISTWSFSGEHVRDVSDAIVRLINSAVGLSSGELLVTIVQPQEEELKQILSRLSPDSEEVHRYPMLTIDRNEGTSIIWPRPGFAATRAGRLYVTASAEYQVHAFDPDGPQAWALRVPWARMPVTQKALGRSTERTRRAGRAMSANVRGDDRAPEWPEFFPALAGIEVDGRGFLYVFPHVQDPDSAKTFPADVYSPEGEFVAAVTLPFQSWDAQLREHVYRAEEDPDTGAFRIVRYRLGPPR